MKQYINFFSAPPRLVAYFLPLDYNKAPVRSNNSVLVKVIAYPKPDISWTCDEHFLDKINYIPSIMEQPNVINSKY